MRMHRSVRLVPLFALTIIVVAQTAKRPLHHRDYDSWRSIPAQVLSRDGKFLAYALFPQEGDGQIVVRNLTTGKELKENAGALPPASDNNAEEGPPPEVLAARNIRITFTNDVHYVVTNVFPSKADADKAKKERKRPDEMPQAGIMIVDLMTLTATRVPDVATFQVPESGASFVAYLKTTKPDKAATPTPEANDDDGAITDQRRPGGGAAAGRGRKKYGAELMLRDLRTNGAKERIFEDVLEYTISKDAGTLLYAVGSKKEETNGVYAVTPGTDAAPATLLAGKGRYSKLVWDFPQSRAVFLSDRDDAASKPAKFKAYVWDRKAAAPVEMISTTTPGFRDGFLIAERGSLNFSRDGSKLFVSCSPKELIATAEAAENATPGAAPVTEEKAVADLWHWKDEYVQPMQKVRAAQERSRSYLAALDFSTKKFVQLADATMPGVTPADTGKYALGYDDRAYRHMVDYDGNYNDYYIVDETTGARKLLLKKMRGAGGGGRRGGGVNGVQWSPDATHLIAFKDKHWWSITAPDGKETNLTANLGTAFVIEDHDTPDEAPAYGAAGWTKDGKWALVYDRFDVWAVAADGSSSKKLTDGRTSNLQFRLVRMETSEDDEQRGIDATKPLLFRAESLETRETGFYSLASLTAQPKRLMMGAKNYRTVAKAKDADVVILTATTFRDQPDLHVTDSSFQKISKVTDANPQQAQLLWGTSELIKYRNADGAELQAVLYKPENFDPARKYPMIIYIYEKLSQNVYNFIRPAPGHSINITYYVSNGYLVLTPDIVYTTGHPGQSALKCVLPAIQAVVDKGYVNRNAIGIQGHSWGGYQAAYLLTQTNVFRAAEAGAPVANMISAYDGIRWGTGLPRQFQYEKTQSRIGGSVWQSPLQFIENSPIFMVDRINTPLLILHNDADDAVPWYQGIELFLSMRRLGKEVYMFDYNGEPHHLNKRPNQKDYTVRMQQFFDHYLKDAQTPEWMEKGVRYTDREREKDKFNAVYTEADPAGKN